VNRISARGGREEERKREGKAKCRARRYVFPRLLEDASRKESEKGRKGEKKGETQQEQHGHDAPDMSAGKKGGYRIDRREGKKRNRVFPILPYSRVVREEGGGKEKRGGEGVRQLEA